MAAEEKIYVGTLTSPVATLAYIPSGFPAPVLAVVTREPPCSAPLLAICLLLTSRPSSAIAARVA